MKAIILAAGCGTRLNKYTKDLPKTMLNVFGKTIIQHQVDLFKNLGFQEIIIVKGYKAEKINIECTKSYINELYSSTNMLESLFCAKEEICGDVLISYGDIIFEQRVVEQIIEDKSDIGVVVDIEWKEYWNARYGRIDFDTESLTLDEKGNIIELGQDNPPVDKIDGRYVGLIKLSNNGCEKIKKIYLMAKSNYNGKIWLNNRPFEKVFMTDFLQEIINQYNEVKAIKIKKGWLEFDTNEDYELFSDLKTSNLKHFINLK
jgi:L-glutamine-phosphate cytidylyltransferase